MNKIVISVVIPVSDTADLDLLGRCIQSIGVQKFKPLETTLVASGPQTKKIKKRGYEKLLPQIKFNLIATDLTKSQARNLGTAKSKGNFILHVDVDYILHSHILLKCAELIDNKHPKAIVLYETTEEKTIWQRARKFERDVISDMEMLSAPQLVEKKLLDKIGGFDEEVDELDDWALLMRLIAANVEIEVIKDPKTKVNEPTNVFTISKRRFRKGRYLKLFRSKYSFEQLNVNSLFEAYWENKRLIVANPITFLALVILKVFDTLPFWIGFLFPHPIKKDLASSYKETSVVHSFIDEQSSIYGKLKHKYEVYRLNRVLKSISVKSALELGCGTGRITKVMMRNGIKVKPTDISKSMLQEYVKDKSLPKPMLIKGSHLPFADESYDLVIAFRVIWHIRDQVKRDKLFQEVARVSNKYIIVDLATSSSFTSKSDHVYKNTEIINYCEKYNLKIRGKHWLPLGRFLFLFEKRI